MHGTLDHLDVKLDDSLRHEVYVSKVENLEVLIDYRMVQTMDDRIIMILNSTNCISVTQSCD